MDSIPEEEKESVKNSNYYSELSNLMRVMPEKDKLKWCLGIQILNALGETLRTTTITTYIDHHITFV